MREYNLHRAQIEERAVAVANYIIEHNATVRQAARQFGVSKSTVHKDVTERLMQVNPALASEARKVLDLNKSERLLQINPTLAAQARKILDINKSERHIRGGMATKDKYLREKYQMQQGYGLQEAQR